MITLNRRHVVLGTLGAAGALIVGWGVLPPRQRLLPGEPLATVPGQVALNGWVKLSTDDTVTVVMSQAEMGQGIHTGLAMLLADEMDADWSKVRLETSNFDKIYNNQAMIVDRLRDVRGQGAGIANAGGAPITHQIKTQLIKIGR